MTQPQNKSWQISKPALHSRQGIVASQSRVAAQVGADIMAQGGNAVDAAIATSFALGAAEPWMSGMGGGGFMIVRLAGEKTAKVIEFGMKSPIGLEVEDYPIVGGKADDLFPWPSVLEDRNVMGAKAVAIPGQVAGMGLAHQTFATMDWADLIAPAIGLAQSGLPVDWYAQLIIGGSAKDLAPFPASARTFLDEGGFPKASGWTALGETRCNLDRLADSLGVVAQGGPRAFYEGPLAQSIIDDLTAAGGRHSLEDLAKYKASIVDAMHFPYRDHEIMATPTLTAGPTMRRALELMSAWHPRGKLPDGETYITYDRAIRQANQERYATMGDTEHEPDPSCTTHFSIVDAQGNMVAVTQTLLSIFGSRLMLPGSGILMNNGIMWFDPEPGKPNSLAPNKRCLANMCPTILARSDGSQFAIGASGGRKIMPAVVELTSLLLDFGMDLETAFHHPRTDMSMDDVTIVDDAMSPEVIDTLKDSLANVVTAPRTIFPYHFACPSGVGRKDGENVGATEIMSAWGDAVGADA
ncbi:MAG: gamma-glutamyltransferase [Sulfitobacter sp.]|uniref:gamma-glutamyltransferase n=2 Tax=Sulfitobacter sp. TaxID=1903071 RepID=UPI004058EAA0